MLPIIFAAAMVFKAGCIGSADAKLVQQFLQDQREMARFYENQAIGAQGKADAERRAGIDQSYDAGDAEDDRQRAEHMRPVADVIEALLSAAPKCNRLPAHR